MNSSTRASPSFPVFRLAGLLALAVFVWYLASMLARTGGALSPPLDDTYIYLQYARRLATGHGFVYTDGAAPSTGASSILHLLLLVPGWWIGFHDVSFVGLAVALGGVYLAAALGAAARAASDLVPTGRTWAIVTALVVAAGSGHFVWGAFTGMDTGLYAAGLALTVAAAARRGARPGRAWLMAGLLGLLRPEGLPMGLVALAVFYAAAWSGRRDGDGAARIGSALRRLRWLFAGLLLLVTPLLFNWIVAGSPVGDSAAVKSLFAETRADVLRAQIELLPNVWKQILLLHLNNFRSGSWNGMTDLVLMWVQAIGLVVGAGALMFGRRGAAARLVVLWFALTVLMGALSPGWSSHNFRYQSPGVPLAAILVVCGWEALTRKFPGRLRSGARFAITAGLAVLLWPGTLHMRSVYGRNCANIHDQQTRVGRWINANTPGFTRVALNDAGAIAYFGNRPTLDLVGLTSHGWAAANRMGSGGLFEKLESLPVAERPQILAVYPKWYPYLTATSLAGHVLMSADLVDNTICGDRLKRVYGIDWRMAGSGARPVERASLVDDFGMSIVDELDVADLDSEAAHGYGWRTTFRDRLREFRTGADGAVVIDGGRFVSEGESMTVRARPGQWLIMVMRTETERGTDLDVTVNGRPAGRLTAGRLALAFTEPLLQIPDSLVTDTLLTVDVRLAGRIAPGAAQPVMDDGYASYHYWFLQ